MPPPKQRHLCRYRYDPLDRLIIQTQADTPVLERFYRDDRLTTEIQGALTDSIIQHDSLLLAQQRNRGGVCETMMVATDQQRSILQTLMSNNHRAPIAYSPYGHRLAESGLSTLLGFNGERRDPVTGLYMLGNGYRAFNPRLMQFHSPDSLSPFAKGGMNPYTYCSGDPVNFVDPSGHVLEWIKKIGSAPVGRNAPLANTLDGLNFDGFQAITKYLDRADMDNLAMTSKTLRENSLDAGLSNLKQYLRGKQVTQQPVRDHLSSPRTLTVQVQSASGPGTITVPPLKGVGSDAFKRLDSSVDGSRRLNEHVRLFKTRAPSVVPKNPADIAKTREAAVNSIVARSLLSALRK